MKQESRHSSPSWFKVLLLSRVYKFRIEPTPLQEKYLLRAAMGCRYIYKLGLQQRNLVHKGNLTSLTELYSQRLLELQQQKAASWARQKLAGQSSLGSDQNRLQKPIQHKVTVRSWIRNWLCYGDKWIGWKRSHSVFYRMTWLLMFKKLSGTSNVVIKVMNGFKRP